MRMTLFFRRALLLVLSGLLLLASVGCADGGEESASSRPISSRGVSSWAASAADSVAASSEDTDPYSPIIYEVAQARDRFYVNGRTMPVAAGTQTGLLFDHAGQGFFFTADCEGTVTVDLALTSEGKTGTDYQLFSLRVDGQASEQTLESGPTETVRTLTLAENLPRGRHTFALYHCNEPMLGLATLLSVRMNGRAAVYTAPEGQLRLAFLGDSITAGHGSRCANGQPGQYHNKNRDATYAYAFLCAQALDADYQIVARSGMATTSAPDAASNALQYYGCYSYERAERVAYDPAGAPVDVFVIALGTNDSGANRAKESAAALLARVRADYPNAKIVWAYGPMALTYKDAYAAAVEEAGGAGKGFYYFQFSQINRDGGASHPDAEHQALYAQELADFIRTIV